MFIFFFISWRRRLGGVTQWRGKRKPAEKDRGKESKFFPQMWFTSWSGREPASELLYTLMQQHCYTHTHAFKVVLINPHPNDNVAVTEKAELPTAAVLFGEKTAPPFLRRLRFFSAFGYGTVWRVIVIHAVTHIYVRSHEPTDTQEYKQKATKTNSRLHFLLQLQGIPSVNMTWGMTELEVGNAVSHAELSLTFTLKWTQTGPLSAGQDLWVKQQTAEIKTSPAVTHSRTLLLVICFIYFIFLGYLNALSSNCTSQSYCTSAELCHNTQKTSQHMLGVWLHNHNPRWVSTNFCFWILWFEKIKYFSPS